MAQGHVVSRLVGVAVDARVAAPSAEPRARAHAAGWIAANALAARGISVQLMGMRPRPTLLQLRTLDLTTTLAAIAAVPALVDTTAMPRSWVLALRLLGVPMLDRPAAAAIARGASVASLLVAPYTLEVTPDFTVQIEHQTRLLAA